jgi:uncharacterized membrane protein (DUF4010 family)
MNVPEETLSYLTALGIGFLIGIVRERLHQPGALMAGVRTHTVAALMGAVAFHLGMPIFVVALGITGLLIGVGYYRSYATDPGMTGEVSLAMTVLLGGLAVPSSALAAALGVAVAVLLFLKKPLRKFSQELLTEYELEDALILFAAAIIVLPLLPQVAIDPWGALKPFDIWKVVVIIMCTGMLGHLAIRLKGVQWGLPIASLLSGLISSTAVIMDLGRKVKQDAAMTGIACASALLSTLASLILFALVLGASSMHLLQSVAVPLLLGGLSLLLTAVALFKHHQLPLGFALTSSQRAFQLKHVLLIAFSISSISLASTWIGSVYGQAGTFISAVIVGFAEIHAAAVSISQLVKPEGVVNPLARWGVLAILMASVVSKSTLSFISGGLRYGLRMTAALTLFVLIAGIGIAFT